MKKKKQNISDSVAEVVVELLLTIIFLAIGFLVCFGISLAFSVDMENFDFDSFVLIGIISLVVIIVLICLIKRFFKKYKRKNR